MMEQDKQVQREEPELEINLGEIFFSVVRRWWIIVICLAVGALAGFGYTQIFYEYKPIYYTSFDMRLTYGTPPADGVEITTTTTTPAAIRQTLAYLNSEVFCDFMQKKMPEGSLTIVPGVDIYDVVALEQKSTTNTDNLYPTSGVSTKKDEMSVTYVYTTSEARITAIVSGERVSDVRQLSKLLVETIPEYIRVKALDDKYNEIANDFNFESLSVKVGDKVFIKNPNENITTHIKNIFIFGSISVVLSVVALVLIYLLDNRIKNTDDIIKCVDVPVLGVIPNIPEVKTAANTVKQGDR